MEQIIFHSILLWFFLSTEKASETEKGKHHLYENKKSISNGKYN